jgi:hypothetical protein
MNAKRTLIWTIVMVPFIAMIALAAGDWSQAQRDTDQFLSANANLRQTMYESTKEIVSRIAEAGEYERGQVAADALDRARSLVNSRASDLERFYRSANTSLEAVLGDDKLKDYHSKARDLRDTIGSRWQSLQRMLDGTFRGSNHPIVAFMLRAGQEAHREYQGGQCSLAEFTLASGLRVDCLVKAPDCIVIELKPKNSRAVREGLDQVRRYTEELNTEGSKSRAALLGNSEFASCKKFTTRVDCYVLVPDPRSDNIAEFSTPSASWYKDCS